MSITKFNRELGLKVKTDVLIDALLPVRISLHYTILIYLHVGSLLVELNTIKLLC